MGVENAKQRGSDFKMTKNYFEFLYIIGRGGFGKVWKVKLKKTHEFFALKAMSKVKIIDRRSEKSIKNERDFLSILNHPFIVNMHFAFQDIENLYLVLDYLTGGDLRYHVVKHRHFSEKQTKFFISCIVSGLEYIHSVNIIHRDIKPENLVLDKDGYVKITDFGVAKKNQKDNSSETSGTPGYMAPEVLFYQNHSFPADFFAIGVIAFEFMFGMRPYQGRSRQEIKEQILHKQIHLSKEDLVPGWSIHSIDFINKLLERKPEKRLGYNSISEIKEHLWMKEINFEHLIKHQLVSSFQPGSGDNFDKRYCENKEREGAETLERYQEYLEDDEFYKIFEGYTVCNYTPSKVEITKPNINFLNDNNKKVSLVKSSLQKNKINIFKRTLSSGGASSNNINKNANHPKGIVLHSKEKITIHNELQNFGKEITLHPSCSVGMIHKKETEQNKNAIKVNLKNRKQSSIRTLQLKDIINNNSKNSAYTQRIKKSFILPINTPKVKTLTRFPSITTERDSKKKVKPQNLPNINNLVKHNSYGNMLHCLSGKAKLDLSKHVTYEGPNGKKQNSHTVSKGKMIIKGKTSTISSFSSSFFKKTKKNHHLMINTFYNKSLKPQKKVNELSA